MILRHGVDLRRKKALDLPSAFFNQGWFSLIQLANLFG